MKNPNDTVWVAEVRFDRGRYTAWEIFRRYEKAKEWLTPVRVIWEAA